MLILDEKVWLIVSTKLYQRYSVGILKLYEGQLLPHQTPSWCAVMLGQYRAVP